MSNKKRTPRLLLFFWVSLIVVFVSFQPINGATIRGTMTKASVGIAGYRVTAVREIRAGYKIGNKPCKESYPNITNLGSVETGADGSFLLSYTAIQKPPGACSFLAQLYIKVYDGQNLVWTSPKILARGSVLISHEFEPCPPLESEGNLINHIFLGNDPDELKSDWSAEAQGLTHDAAHWYITQRHAIWRVPGQSQSK